MTDPAHLGTSPRSSILADSLAATSGKKESNEQLSLHEFLDRIPTAIEELKSSKQSNDNSDEDHVDPVMKVFQSLCMNDTDDSWRRYAHADATQRYTRNLIATDHESFVLMALVWNANCESAIHDHPCDGCWWKVLQGTVQECRYKYNDNVDDEQHTVDETSDPTNNPLICYQDCTYQQGDVAFMDNTLGLHKVGNPSHDQPAVTLHLYAPPFPRCRVFSANDARVHHTATVTFYSKYGVVVNNK